MKITALLPLLLIHFQALSQQLHPDVLASAGTQQFSTNNQAYLSFTVGEVAIETLTQPGISYGQGFHQGSKAIVSTNDPAFENWNLLVYPNPAGNFLYVHFESPESGRDLHAGVWNLLGQQLITDLVLPDRVASSIELGTLPAGAYLLKLSEATGQSTTIPFIKASNE
jgi:hypothetical protein